MKNLIFNLVVQQNLNIEHTNIRNIAHYMNTDSKEVVISIRDYSNERKDFYVTVNNYELIDLLNKIPNKLQ